MYLNSLITENKSLEHWIKRAKDLGVQDALLIDPKELNCCERVRLKCQYGCKCYNTNYCCPPDTPVPSVSQKILYKYSQGMFLQFSPLSNHSNIVDYIKYNNFITNITSQLEREIFLAGFPFAFSMNSGPCYLCTVIKNNVFRKYTCRKNIGISTILVEKFKGLWKSNRNSKNLSVKRSIAIYEQLSLLYRCKYPDLARPAMEAMGIDVFQAAKKFGFNISVCKSHHHLPHYFSLVLID